MSMSEDTCDQVNLPCCDKQIPLDALFFCQGTPDFANAYKKEFLVINDSIFYTFADNATVPVLPFYSEDREANDDYCASRIQIKDHANDILKYDTRDAVHVLSFGFDDIRFNRDKDPAEIGAKILEALNAAAEKVEGRGIKLWFLTIPEIGDLAANFHKFNEFIRKSARIGTLKNVALLDFSKMTSTFLRSTVAERFGMLLWFFEQTCNLRLLTDDVKTQFSVIQEDPNSFVVLTNAFPGSPKDFDFYVSIGCDPNALVHLFAAQTFG